MLESKLSPVRSVGIDCQLTAGHETRQPIGVLEKWLVNQG